jgi:hypothetical protein
MSLQPINATIASRSNVPAATTVTQLLAINSARKGYAIYNTGSGILNIALGVAPSAATAATDYSFAIAGGSYYESVVDFTGLISGTWSAAGGSALITEFS